MKEDCPLRNALPEAHTFPKFQALDEILKTIIKLKVKAIVFSQYISVCAFVNEVCIQRSND